MIISDAVLDLYETFQLRKIDVLDRDYAGSYLNGKLYIVKEHIQAFHKMPRDKDGQQPKINEMIALYFLTYKQRVICFIDCISLFPKPPLEDVVNSVVQEVPGVMEIYLYKYPNEIRLIEGY